jgi:Cys-tRNA synthase (O-phospho-L-seryl-tRNA:Cys-tRNA synthase)
MPGAGVLFAYGAMLMIADFGLWIMARRLWRVAWNREVGRGGVFLQTMASMGGSRGSHRGCTPKSHKLLHIVTRTPKP